MMNQPTNLGAITERRIERRIERVLTREDCMELALHQIIIKCDEVGPVAPRVAEQPIKKET